MSNLEKRICEDGIDEIVLTAYIEERRENLEEEDRLLLQEARDAILNESKSVLKNCNVTLLGNKVKVEFISGDGKNKCCVHLNGSNEPKSYWKNRHGTDDESTLSDVESDAESENGHSLDENVMMHLDITSEAEPESNMPIIDIQSLNRRWKLLTDSFAVYYEGTLDGEKRVMIKQSKDEELANKERVQKEAQILWDLDHNHIVKFHGMCEDPVCAVMEFLENGTLQQYLIDNGNRLNLSDAVRMASQVASAISYLGLKGYIHRDIAARNVFVGTNKICKLAGFTLAVKLENGTFSPTGENTIPIKWSAPECFLGDPLTPKCDMWSFGILLIEILLHGAEPYPGLTTGEVKKVLQYGYIHNRPKNCPIELYLIMQQCWETDPEDRPSFDNVISGLDLLKFD